MKDIYLYSSFSTKTVLFRWRCLHKRYRHICRPLWVGGFNYNHVQTMLCSNGKCPPPAYVVEPSSTSHVLSITWSGWFHPSRDLSLWCGERVKNWIAIPLGSWCRITYHIAFAWILQGSWFLQRERQLWIAVQCILVNSYDGKINGWYLLSVQRAFAVLYMHGFWCPGRGYTWLWEEVG